VRDQANKTSFMHFNYYIFDEALLLL